MADDAMGDSDPAILYYRLLSYRRWTACDFRNKQQRKSGVKYWQPADCTVRWHLANEMAIRAARHNKTNSSSNKNTNIYAKKK